MRRPEHMEEVAEALWNAMTPAERAVYMAKHIAALAQAKSYDRWFPSSGQTPKAQS